MDQFIEWLIVPPLCCSAGEGLLSRHLHCVTYEDTAWPANILCRSCFRLVFIMVRHVRMCLNAGNHGVRANGNSVTNNADWLALMTPHAATDDPIVSKPKKWRDTSDLFFYVVFSFSVSAQPTWSGFPTFKSDPCLISVLTCAQTNCFHFEQPTCETALWLPIQKKERSRRQAVAFRLVLVFFKKARPCEPVQDRLLALWEVAIGLGTSRAEEASPLLKPGRMQQICKFDNASHEGNTWENYNLRVSTTESLAEIWIISDSFPRRDGGPIRIWRYIH